jgi:hypothetical protein
MPLSMHSQQYGVYHLSFCSDETFNLKFGAEYYLSVIAKKQLHHRTNLHPENGFTLRIMPNNFIRWECYDIIIIPCESRISVAE